MAKKRTSKRVQAQPAQAAVLDAATGEATRVVAARPATLSKTKLLKVLGDLGMRPMGGSMELTSHVMLSARVPWVEGKGYLNALNPRTFFADGPGIHFVPESGQPTGRLEIWLNGLEAGADYLMRIEVGSIGSSSFDVRAVTLGAGVVTQVFQPAGGFDTLLLQFPGGDGGMGMVRIECADWSFYETEISRFGS